MIYKIWRKKCFCFCIWIVSLQAVSSHQDVKIFITGYIFYLLYYLLFTGITGTYIHISIFCHWLLRQIYSIYILGINNYVYILYKIWRKLFFLFNTNFYFKAVNAHQDIKPYKTWLSSPFIFCDWSFNWGKYIILSLKIINYIF